MKHNNSECKTYIKDFKTLKVYQKSLEICDEIFKITKQFPGEEKYRLTDQMIRATTSIGANIAEGVGQEFKAKTINFCNIALGSANEMRHWIKIAMMQGYVSEGKFIEIDDRLSEICKMLIGYITMLKKELKAE